MKIYTPSTDLTWNDAADEVVLFHRESGAYYALGESGTAIWRAMRGGRAIAEIAASLMESYAGSRDLVEADVAAFIAQAEAMGLVSAK